MSYDSFEFLFGEERANVFDNVLFNID